MGRLLNENEHFIAVKILERRYAVDMIKYGRIQFSCAENWSKIIIKGQGDKNEGIFGRQINNNEIKVEELMKKYHYNIDLNKSNKYVTYKRKDVCKLPAYCFYVINNSRWKLTFTDKQIDNENICRGITKISKHYINDFYRSNKINNEKDYNKTDLNDRPAIVIIFKPQIFEEKLVETIKSKFLIDERNILKNLINYRKSNNDIFINEHHPYELFNKDNRFSRQLEYRFVINDSSVMAEIPKENNNKFIIDIGNLSNCAVILKDQYYKNDLLCEANLIIEKRL